MGKRLEEGAGRCTLICIIGAQGVHSEYLSVQVTKDGFYGILSAGWYLNNVAYGADWVRMYDQDPQDISGTPEQKNRVLGGEVDDQNDTTLDVKVLIIIIM